MFGLTEKNEAEILRPARRGIHHNALRRYKMAKQYNCPCYRCRIDRQNAKLVIAKIEGHEEAEIRRQVQCFMAGYKRANGSQSDRGFDSAERRIRLCLNRVDDSQTEQPYQDYFLRN